MFDVFDLCSKPILTELNRENDGNAIILALRLFVLIFFRHPKWLANVLQLAGLAARRRAELHDWWKSSSSGDGSVAAAWRCRNGGKSPGVCLLVEAGGFEHWPFNAARSLDGALTGCPFPPNVGR